MEKCFFLNNHGYDLFACLTTPDESENNRIGVVFCSPFAEEKLWAQRLFVNFSRYLGKIGFTVLRFDYMGTGDSAGDFEKSDIVSNLSDIRCAAKFLREHAGVKKVGLLGLRYGATLAAKAAEAAAVNIDFLVLWEPVINLQQYLLQCLRSNLTTQMVTYKKIVYTREQMIEDLKSGKSVNIDGYILSADFYRQAASIDLSKENISFSKPVQILSISKMKKEGIPANIKAIYEKYKIHSETVEQDVLVEKPFWGDLKEYFQISEKLFELTGNFLSRIS